MFPSHDQEGASCDKESTEVIFLTVDDAQDARLDRIDARLRAVEEVIVELRAITKLIRPIILIAAASLGLDVAPHLM